jgi:hypothetical protein
MTTTLFTAINNSPDLIGQDQNFTHHLYVGKKSLGLTVESTEGLSSPGPVEPGSYSSPLETGTNETRLGATKVPKSQHWNSQAMTIQANLIGINPLGLKLKNKNSIAQTVQYKASAATTVDTGGAGTLTLTLVAVTNFAVGSMVEIEMPAGYPEYRRVQVLDTVGKEITLDYPLLVAPDEGADVKVVTGVTDKPGGSRPEKWSVLALHSGDFDDRLIHFFDDVRVSSGNLNLPDANAGGIALNLMVFPKTEVHAGRSEPIFMTERLVFEDEA